MKGNTSTIKLLQKALNAGGDKILIRTKQFYSDKEKTPVTIWYVERGVFDEAAKKYKNDELFHTSSSLQVILFLADLVKLQKNEPLSTDNEIWNEKRKNIEYYSTVEGITYEQKEGE